MEGPPLRVIAEELSQLTGKYVARVSGENKKHNYTKEVERTNLAIDGVRIDRKDAKNERKRDRTTNSRTIHLSNSLQR